jgi:hypothetical protein
VRSLFGLMDVALEVPDQTTLSRRSKQLRVDLRRVRRAERIHLVIDSSGLSIVGQGEWATAKHGGSSRRGWKKLHLGVDANGEILAQVLTDSVGDDPSNGLDLIDRVDGDVGSITADAAYDTVAMYDAGARRGARVIIPPSRTASVSRRKPRSRARDRTIRRVEKLGRRRWKKASGYHRQGTVENALFRYKTIISDRLRGRTSETQEVEARLACEILNRMAALGRPSSVAIKS